MKKRSTVFAAFGAAVALLGGPLVASAPADVLSVSDVAASIVAPATTQGAFSVVGTITNSGGLDQPSGSKMTFSATNGSVTSAPTGCTIGAGSAVCTVGALPGGASINVTVGVTPAAGANSVGTQLVVQAAQLESPVLDPTNNTASAVTGVAYGVDASITNQPTVVRYDDDTLLSSTVTNTKAPQTLNVVLASGGVIDTRIATPTGCTITNAGKNLSCAFALGAGQSKSFDTAVTAPTSGTSITSTLSVTGANAGSKSVSVVTNLSNDAQAFVPAGDHLNFAGSNQFTDFSVPVGSAPGLFLKLQEVTLNNVSCGTSTCIRQAAEALFPSTGTYSGTDPNKPFVWNIRYDERQVCNGVGGGSGCLIDMYWIPSGGTATQPMALCPTYGTTQAPRLNNIAAPCLQKVDKGIKGFSTYTVAVLRDIVIPIISGTRS